MLHGGEWSFNSDWTGEGVSSILTLFGGLRERLDGLLSTYLLELCRRDFLPGLLSSFNKGVMLRGRDSDDTPLSSSGFSVMLNRLDFFPMSDILRVTEVFLGSCEASTVVLERRRVAFPELL